MNATDKSQPAEDQQKSEKQSSPGFVRTLEFVALILFALGLVAIARSEQPIDWYKFTFMVCLTLSAGCMLITGKSPASWWVRFFA